MHTLQQKNQFCRGGSSVPSRKQKRARMEKSPYNTKNDNRVGIFSTPPEKPSLCKGGGTIADGGRIVNI
jgi:hypothetical protein